MSGTNDFISEHEAGTCQAFKLKQSVHLFKLKLVMDLEPECQESVAITFEWTVRGLHNLFDSTKGESKSKVTKSARFGGGRWQVCAS